MNNIRYNFKMCMYFFLRNKVFLKKNNNIYNSKLNCVSITYHFKQIDKYDIHA